MSYNSPETLGALGTLVCVVSGVIGVWGTWVVRVMLGNLNTYPQRAYFYRFVSKTIGVVRGHFLQIQNYRGEQAYIPISLWESGSCLRSQRTVEEGA